MKGKLILEDGSVFTGDLLNEYKATGEVVFNTGMTGYQEILTDPSYCSQIVTLTFPLIGNYGVADKFMQSRKSFVNGFIIGELCDEGSNWQKENELAKFLNDQKIPCLYNVDTRAVTRTIRSQGCMKGIIVSEDASQEEIDKLMAVPIKLDVVAEVTTPETYVMDNDGPHVVVMDFGIKQNILLAVLGTGATVAELVDAIVQEASVVTQVLEFVLQIGCVAL
ncbi:MAG: carbamoyl phosphate synthase small subunit, partial [Anaerovibrio sp.]|nr:carbamoyl phosphate synthase small subunit [Anaerovibrio sp.]